MNAIEKRNWHGKLHALSYAMFDSTPPDRPLPWAYWTTVFGTMAYCGAALAVFLTLNICTLPFGVLAEPIWWRNADFRLLHFPNGLPITPFLVMFALVYASWCTWERHGPLMAVAPWLFVGALSAVGIGLSIATNKMRAVSSRSAASK